MNSSSEEELALLTFVVIDDEKYTLYTIVYNAT